MCTDNCQYFGRSILFPSFEQKTRCCQIIGIVNLLWAGRMERPRSVGRRQQSESNAGRHLLHHRDLHTAALEHGRDVAANHRRLAVAAARPLAASDPWRPSDGYL
jgi:hypothetical protein